METFDLNLVQGETFGPVTFRDLIDGVAQPLAGLTVKSQIRRAESVTSALLLDLAQYIALDADGETLRLRIPANVTAALDSSPKVFKKAAWDLFLTDPSDPTEGRRLISGLATCDPAATQTLEIA